MQRAIQIVGHLKFIFSGNDFNGAMNQTTRLTKLLVFHAILATTFCAAAEPLSSPRSPATKKRSSNSTKKYFLVKTREGEALYRRLSQSIDTLSHPLCHIVAAAGTLVDASPHFNAEGLSLGTFYHLHGDQLECPEELGHVSLRMGSSPVSFETRRCRWMGSMVRCDFRSSPDSFAGGLKLLREIYVDRRGIVCISLRLTASSKSGRELLATHKFHFRVEPPGSLKSRWRVGYRLPDGSVRRLDQKRYSFECELPSGGKSSSRELLIVVAPMGDSTESVVTLDDEADFEEKVSRRYPISSMRSAMRRWIVSQFPAWDCPEPWLNNLWSGQVVSLCQELAVDRESGDLVIELNSPDDWRLIHDARWLKDPKIVRRSLEHQIHDLNQKTLAQVGLIAPAALAVFECNPSAQFRTAVTEKLVPVITLLDKTFPDTQATQATRPRPALLHRKNNEKLLFINYAVLAEWSADRRSAFFHRARRLAAGLNVSYPREITSPELLTIISPEFSPADYAGFVQWCRSFFPEGDFAHLGDFCIDSAHRRVKKAIPRGVMDMIITNVVGLKTHSSDRLKIAPALWINHWDYFAIDNLPYRGHNLTIVWQSPDHVQRYAEIPQGLSVFIDGRCVKQSQELETMEIELK